MKPRLFSCWNLHVENTQVGPFLVIKKVGSHRRHNVYHARQVKQERDVALKFLSWPKEISVSQALAKVNHESKLIKRLSHPHICKLYGVGAVDEKIFLAMELVDGEALYAILRRLGRLAPDVVIEYGIQLAEALEYLHKEELLHGSLNTEKVMITPEWQTKLLGVRVNRPHRRRWDAATRAMPETAAYMPPEQLLGEGCTGKSDLYSLGVLLYEMATGKLPFEPKTIGQLIQDKQTNKVRPVTDHVMNCPAALNKLIMKMIQPNPKHRPYSAKAVALTLKQIRDVDQSKQAVAVEMTKGFSPLTAGKDKTEARKLLGQKIEGQKKNKGPLVQSIPFLVGGIVLIGLIISLITFWPFSAKRVDLMTRANTLMESSKPQDWRDARKIYQRIMDSSDELMAEEALQQYYLSRRKSMLYRLDRAVSGLEKAEVREFSRGYLLQKQRQPEQALAFFQHFVDNYDRENRLVYVYDEAQQRLEQLLSDQQQSIKDLATLEEKLTTADELAGDTKTRVAAREIWESIITAYDKNDFLQLQVQRAQTGLATFPLEKSTVDAAHGFATEDSSQLPDDRSSSTGDDDAVIEPESESGVGTDPGKL